MDEGYTILWYLFILAVVLIVLAYHTGSQGILSAIFGLANRLIGVVVSQIVPRQQPAH